MKELTLWQRVDALRELLHQGGHLLGEVATLIRNAEESLAVAAADKKVLEQSRRSLEEECLQLRREARLARPEELSPKNSRLLADLQNRLQLAESQLEHTRATLASERERRNRAISLIKPASSDAAALQSSSSA
jgi:vacuolar-type H+-ATPase subunit I/STV1